jgi:hypothetical protein
MKMEFSAYVMRSDGMIYDLPMTEELAATLHSLGQETGAGHREDRAEGGTIWEFVQALKQTMVLQAQQVRS